MHYLLWVESEMSPTGQHFEQYSLDGAVIFGDYGTSQSQRLGLVRWLRK